MIPSPDSPARIADRAVAFVEQKFGILLPYNPPSLILVDAIVDKIKATGASEQEASGLLMGLGFYVDEVFVRHTRGTWRPTAEMKMSRVCVFPMVVALPGAVGCNPIGQVFERFRTGEDASVATFYQKTLAPPPVRARGH